MNHCLACTSDNLSTIPTKMSPFMADKIFGIKNGGGGYPLTNILHCNDCGFAFYEKRLTDEELSKYYANYWSKEHQKLRQHYDVWYTEQINAICAGHHVVDDNRKLIIESFLKQYVFSELATALDYGGGRGQLYPDILSATKKYVYDISAAEPLEGIISIRDYDKLKSMDFDFVMCNQVLEHVSDPNIEIEKIKVLGNKGTFFYMEVPFDSPFYSSKLDNFKFLFNRYFKWSTIIKHFINMKKLDSFAPMTEHVNYFTKNAFETLLKRHGFTIIHSAVVPVDMLWRKTNNISILAKIA